MNLNIDVEITGRPSVRLSSFLSFHLDIIHNFEYNIKKASICGEVKEMEDYMTIKEAAEKWGISTRRVTTLCHEGRIEGVVKFGASFAIPADSEKPADLRIKSGKYINATLDAIAKQLTEEGKLVKEEQTQNVIEN